MTATVLDATPGAHRFYVIHFAQTSRTYTAEIGIHERTIAIDETPTEQTPQSLECVPTAAVCLTRWYTKPNAAG